MAPPIAQSGQRIDLLFTDLGLGDQAEGGLTIGQGAAQSDPGLPVLYTTGQEPTDGMRALFVEPNAFLPKPYTPDRIVKAIFELLRDGKAK